MSNTNLYWALLGSAALLATGCVYENHRADPLVRSHSSVVVDDAQGGNTPTYVSGLSKLYAPRGGRDAWTSLFDGQSLTGWRFVGKAEEGYRVRNGAIVAEKGVRGNLFTEKEYGDFVLQFEFLLGDPGANNGIGIRAPLDGDAAYVGMELQVLEEAGAEAKHGKLRPEQFHGSIYDCIPATRGALKPVGQWNTQEIYAQGRHIKVTVNGRVILDANLNSVTDPTTLLKHPGLLRERGHIGFLGHDDHVEFRNIRIKELASKAPRDNTPPPGFTSFFNGRDLTGWKGLVADPIKRAKMSPAELGAAQAKADEIMRRDWKVENGAIFYRGKGYENLCTVADHGNYELHMDWMVTPLADSGVYLRGAPQVQIWDVAAKGNPKNEGSGGLYNNTKSPTGPLVLADKPPGEWNRFRILMVGDKVSVSLNDKLVVKGLALENYWDRSQPLPSTGPIELQAHDSVVGFKNIYIRPLP